MIFAVSPKGPPVLGDNTTITTITTTTSNKLPV